MGRLRFEKETGIREYDWLKYWARWSDAQREAGLSPNEKSVSYSEGFLIEKFITLMRELARCPTNRELRLKRNNDPEFPSEMSYRRFGTKAPLVEKVIGWCQAQKGYEDVVQICGTIKRDNRSKSEHVIGKAESLGFVYLIKSGRHYKIGKTNSTGRREYELAIQMPEKPKTVHVIKTDDPSGIEAYWHRRFDAKRKGGEWFELTPADVGAFKRRKFM